MKKSKLPFHYAWVVVVATILMNFFYSIVYSSFSLYGASILAKNPDITRTAYSLVPTLHSVWCTVFLLLYGTIVKKLGFRKVMLLGALGLAIGYVIYSFANSIAMFYVGTLFVGMFPAFCSSTTTGSLVNRWFGKYNTTLLSISMAIGGFGGTVGSIICGKWLGTIGYEASFRNMAIIMSVVMAIVILVVRNAPEDVGEEILWGSEADKHAKSQEERPGYTLKQAMKTYSFWAMAAIFFLYAGAFYAAYANVALYMDDLGWEPAVYGVIFGVISTANVIAMFLGGYITDKIGPRITILVLCVAYAIVAFVLGFTTPSVTMMYVVCGLLGVCWLFCKVLHTPFALCFGNRDSASIIAILTACITVGASVGIPLANIVYDKTGSYAALFKGLLGVLVVCLILAFTAIRKQPGYDKVGGPDARD